MTKPRRTLESKGKFTNYVTTGGAGYVPPAINADDVISKLSNLWNYSKTYLKNKFAGTGDGTFIDLSDKNVSRIKSDTKNVNTILTNEFIEKNKNTVRKKKDFVNTTDTLLGDKKIPLSKISIFYGVEDGKLKAGPLSSFKDETVIVPNRAKNIGRVKKILMAPPGANKSLLEKEDSIINSYNQKHGYTQGTFYDIINTIFPWTDPLSPKHVLSRAEGVNAIFRVLNESGEELKFIGNRIITENGDTIPLININPRPKVLFANEQGKAGFLSNILNGRNVESLNKFLTKNPSYPIMVDNGRYATYMDNSPNAEIYGGLNRPDDMFIVGTTNRDKHKYGGIHITSSKRGTFTAAATKHGMGVQEFAVRVLRNKDSYSPAMVKKANFARNASKWNH